jgi:hypothetical protein
MIAAPQNCYTLPAPPLRGSQIRLRIWWGENAKQTRLLEMVARGVPPTKIMKNDFGSPSRGEQALKPQLSSKYPWSLP